MSKFIHVVMYSGTWEGDLLIKIFKIATFTKIFKVYLQRFTRFICKDFIPIQFAPEREMKRNKICGMKKNKINGMKKKIPECFGDQAGTGLEKNSTPAVRGTCAFRDDGGLIRNLLDTIVLW